MDAPCKDCTNRSVTCHISCEEYVAFSNERKRINEARAKEIEKGKCRSRKYSFLRQLAREGKPIW